MLVEQLALTYKCHSSIGNSLDLNEMLKEVMKTILTETFAVYTGFYLRKNNGAFKEVIKVGRAKEFNIANYENGLDKFSKRECVANNNHVVIFLPLKRGVLVIIYNKEHEHLDFLSSMFQGLAHKLNISIDACLNMQALKQKNEKLKILALQLDKQKKDLSNANKYKNDFLANMSHELKTPLNSIIVISSVMKKNRQKKLDEEQVKNMQIINSCGNDLLYLINDILDISKIEAGELAINLSKFNLKALICELYDSMKPLIKDKNIAFVNSMDFEEVEVLSDESRLKQILKNLLSNAFKFTKEGTVEIKSFIEDEKVIIKVIDQGVGISEDKLEYIFDRFKQADGSTTRKHGGTGLGLAISKELSHLLGGDITVSSVVDEGSVFTVQLPLKTAIKNVSDHKVEISDEQNKEESDILFFEQIKPKDKKSLLIVNPDHMLLFPLVVSLKKNDIYFEYVNIIEEAFEKILRESYDAVLINTYNLKEDISSILDEAINKDMKIISINEKVEIKANLTFKNRDVNSSAASKVIKLIRS